MKDRIYTPVFVPCAFPTILLEEITLHSIAVEARQTGQEPLPFGPWISQTPVARPVVPPR